MKEKVLQALSAACGFVASFFTGIPAVVWILIAVMSLDYITGLICGAMGVSPKTENGGLSSRAAFSGLLKKALILCVVILAALLDGAISSSAGVEFAAVTGATSLWFVASEGVSILENAASIGVPIPKILQQALETMKSKGSGNTATDDDEKKPG